MFGICLSVVLFMAAACITSSRVNGSLIVEAPVGMIRGLADNKTVPDKVVHKFLGIPYAKPPVRNLRFEKPSTAEDFQTGEIFNATVYGSPCIQHGLEGNEDCLYLNIFAPLRPNSDVPVPVMVWIHGGAFQFDTAANYEGTVLAGIGNVIVVTVNYRLGVFGFLNMKDKQQASNFGLWDQHMALTWVQRNIRAFGGDPGNVTLFGESAGAASVAYQTMSRYSTGLFRRVGLQSGTALAPWAQNRYPRGYAFDFAQRIGCRDTPNLVDDVEAILTCLRTKTSSQIFEKSQQVDKGGVAESMINFIWVPSVDEDFIEKDPNLMITDEMHLKSIGFFDLDLLLGMNNDEGSLVYLLANFAQIVGENKTVQPSNGIARDFFENKFVPAILRQKFENDTEVTIMAIRYMYEFDDKNGNDSRTMVSFAEWFQTYEDASFLSPITQHALSHSTGRNGGGRTYFYLFDYRPSYETNPRITGLTHGGDVPYVFGFVPSMKASRNINYTTEEGNLANQVIKYWTNFAWSGNPNSPDDNMLAIWPTYDPQHEAFLKLSPTMSSNSVGSRLYSRRAEFWMKFLPAIMFTNKISTDKSQTCSDKTEFLTIYEDRAESQLTIGIIVLGILLAILILILVIVLVMRFRRKSNYTMK